MDEHWIRLNAFQRLTRQWDQMHAYNGLQLMRLRTSFSPQQLADTFNATLSHLQLGDFEYQKGRYRIWPTTALLSAEKFQSSDSLTSTVTHELNEPFPLDRGLPFRPVVVSDERGTYIGVTYHHWAADSFSIRWLLHEWFARMMGVADQRSGRLRIAREGFWNLFGPDRGGWQLVDSFIDSAKWNARFKKVRRVDRTSTEDLSTHFSLHFAEPGLIDRLVRAAKSMGVKVNDLFLAAMARVCDSVPTLQRTPWRQDLALGTIVDLRPYAPSHWPTSFGLFLGFTSLFVRPAELRDDRKLIEAIRLQHDVQRRKGAVQASMLRMTAGLVLPKLLSPVGLTEFYRKRLALSAGISNVNLNPLWPRKFYPDLIQSYIRVSPVGPMMPIVFTPTTLGSELNLGLTCRSNVVDPSAAPKLAQNFFAQLERLSQLGQASVAGKAAAARICTR